MLIRLQKYMAECGAASRRACEELIKQGSVSVDGVIIDTMGFKIDPEVNRVEVEGKLLLPPERLVYLALNKPPGCVTTAKEQFDRPTVMDLLGDLKERVYPVGRLDYNTGGLLFLTNDGNFAHTLTHPSHKVEKTYIAKIDGKISNSSLNMLRNGVYLDGKKTFPAKVKPLKPDTVEITISQGRNRQVRRMFESVGHKVLALTRISIGSVSLGQLKSGCFRFLEPAEVDSFMNSKER